MRKLLLPALAACTMLAISAPVATAKPKAHASASIASKLAKVSGAIKGLKKAVKLLKDVNTGQTASIHDVDTRVDTVVANLTALSGKVDGLATAATSALTTIGAGLTAVGAGLTKLGDNYSADEYGFVQLFVGGVAPANAITGCFGETGNIPDNVQDAMLGMTCYLPAAVPSGAALHLMAGIRSNEVDGTGAADLAGVAGIVSLTATAIGASTGSFGQNTANAGLGGAPAVAIPTKSAPTSTTETSFPFGPISTDSLVDLSGAATYSGSSGVGTPNVSAVGPGGGVVQFTIRFNDLTPASPDPKQ